MAIVNPLFSQEQVEAAEAYEVVLADYEAGLKDWLYKGKPQVKKSRRVEYAAAIKRLWDALDRAHEVGIDWIQTPPDMEMRWDFKDAVDEAVGVR